MKLLRREPECDAFLDGLDERSSAPPLTATSTDVELPRALRRIDPALVARVPDVLARLAGHEIDRVVRATAAAYPTVALRSLHAVHLATAQVVVGSRLTAFGTYDRRLRVAGADPGMPVERPGAAAAAGHRPQRSPSSSPAEPRRRRRPMPPSHTDCGAGTPTATGVRPTMSVCGRRPRTP